ncbi:uncharacterized protein hemgn isoform X2 [Cololabis saira]|uniref:uncharacterized protein hemgn isoform X2 n=1 Tax=Cololabis saira TaxID=129043 RepID=UPI002AD53296|nr:uncharacterized protein hemgn isoform X2 [Cololabis saira]
MEDSSQEKRQELEIENQNEEEGGIRRRLRDRDLLRKRKAEAEEKETNQIESQRKRSRSENKAGSKRRGRPRKTEPTPQLSVVGEEAAAAPAVIVAPEPAAFISDQISGSLTSMLAKEPQPPSVPAAPAPAPVLGSFQSSIFGPLLIPRPPFNTAVEISEAPVQDSAPARAAAAAASTPEPAPVAFTAPSLIQDSAPAAFLAPPIARNQVENLYTESQAREALDQVLIEDLGPDEEEDIAPSQDKRADEGVNEMLLTNVPEQTRMYSVPTFSSASLPQEYFPGN